MTKLNSEAFLDAYGRIEHTLKTMHNSNTVGFVQMVNTMAKNNATIRNFQLDLIEYAQLRNAIVHNRNNHWEAIAEPHTHVVKNIEHIANALERPKRVGEFMHETLFCATPEESLVTLMQRQKGKQYSAIPVYDASGYRGMIHARMFQRLVEDESRHNFDLKELNVSDFLSYYDEEDRVIFVRRDETLYRIVEIYNKIHQTGKKIIAILITDNGTRTGNPIGILTMADLPIILHELE